MISVVVPVYNVAQYLVDCLNSILSQDFQDYEVIMVDDGSTDESGNICDAYAKMDPRFKVVHKKNGGLSSARNVGIEHAFGKWILFLDSDDLWSNSRVLSTLNDYMLKHHFDILRFEYQAVDESLNLIQLPSKDKRHLQNQVLSNFKLVNEGIAGEWFAWLYIIDRKLFNLGIRFDESCLFQEDIDFYCRLFAMDTFRCGYLAEKFYLYRKRENSLTTSYSLKNLLGSFHLCDVFFNQSLITTDSQLKALYRYDSVMMYYWTLITLSESPYYENRQEIISKLSLNHLHKRTIRRLKETSIRCIYLPFIVPLPYWGSFLLRMKNYLICLLR